MSDITERTIQFPYQAQEWSTGQVITQDSLDHIELGIQDVSEQIYNATKTYEAQFIQRGQKINRELYDFFQVLINRLKQTEQSIDKYKEVYEALSFKQEAPSEKSWDSYEVIKNVSVGTLNYSRNRVGSSLTESSGYYIKIIPLPTSQTDYKISCDATNLKIGFDANDKSITTHFRQYDYDNNWTLSQEECTSLVGENVSSVSNPIYYIALTASKFSDYFGTPTNNQYTLNTSAQVTLQPSDINATSITFDCPVYVYTGEEGSPLWDTTTNDTISELNQQFVLSPQQRTVRDSSGIISWPGRKTLTDKDTVIDKSMDYLLVWIGNKVTNINPQGGTGAPRCIYCAPNKLTIKYNNDQDELVIVQNTKSAIDPVQHLTDLLTQAQQNIINETVRLTDNMSLFDLLPHHTGYYDVETGQLVKNEKAEYVRIPVQHHDQIIITGVDNRGNNNIGSNISFIYTWLKDDYSVIQHKTLTFKLTPYQYTDKNGEIKTAYRLDPEDTDLEGKIILQTKKIGQIPYAWCHPGFTIQAPENAAYLYILLKNSNGEDLTPTFIQINDVIITERPIYKSYYDNPITRMLSLKSHVIMPPTSNGITYAGRPVQWGNTSNNQRLSTLPLYFSRDVYLTTTNSDYPVRVHYSDKDSLLTKESDGNGKQYFNLLIKAYQLFYLVIYNDNNVDNNGNRTILSPAEYGIKLTYEPVQQESSINWTALGDSITQGYYSYYSEEAGDTVTNDKGYTYSSKAKTTQGFLHNGLLWRPKSATLSEGSSIRYTDSEDGEANVVRSKKEDLKHNEYRATGTSKNVSKESWAYKAAKKLNWNLTNIAVGGTGFADPWNDAIKTTSGDGPYFSAVQAQLAWYKAWDTNFSKCNLVTIAFGVNDWKDKHYLGDLSKIQLDATGKVSLENSDLNWLNTDTNPETGQPNWNAHLYYHDSLHPKDWEYHKDNKNNEIVPTTKIDENQVEYQVRGKTIAEGLAATIAGVQKTAPEDCLIVVITPLNCLQNYPYESTTPEQVCPNYGLDYSFDNSGTLEDVFDTIVQVCDKLKIQYLDMTHYSPINKFNIKQALIDNVHPSKEMQDMLANDLSKKLNFLYHAPRGNYSQEQILSNVYANDAYKYLHFSLDRDGNLYQLGDKGHKTNPTIRDSSQENN